MSNINCPNCGESQYVIKCGVNKIPLRSGGFTELQMFRCKSCAYHFSSKTLAKYQFKQSQQQDNTNQPIVPTQPETTTQQITTPSSSENNVKLIQDVYDEVARMCAKSGKSIDEWVNNRLHNYLFVKELGKVRDHHKKKQK